VGNQIRKWYLSIEQHPTITVGRLGFESTAGGHQIWDEVAWPLPLSELTEGQVLSELYSLLMDLWETRG
jgi:hypothetical protein